MPDAPRSSLFTCLACHVAFKTADIQREHYRSDWHRYNLKRKMVELPPVTAEMFTQKAVAQQQKAADDQAAAAVSSNECKTCRKSYSSENAYQNHLASKKHKEMEAKLKANPRPAKSVEKPTKSDVESITSKMTVDLSVTDETTQEELEEIMDKKIETAIRLEPTDCLFCTEKTETFESNVEHMTKAHGFFIPDIEYLVDLEGLIKYLGEKVSVGNICLYCNGKGRQIKSLEAVRKHMVDKGHCKIPYDSESEMMEVVDFYDFSSSYPEEQQRRMLEAAEKADAGEIDLDEEELDEDYVGTGARLGEDEMELILPSGARLGHRSLNKYYRQNVKPEESRDSVLINRLLTHYTDHMGYDLALSKSKARSERGQALVARNEGEARWAHKQTSTFKDFRRIEEHKARVGQKQNKLQKHYRVQILV
ncbi:C2H2 type zinc-finger-domain-containing protein [Gamsiella multidivaricata]|uniref:C2H2 type zinc-finger-domain-containing protein n=1 Tax=Gamsiella multidivaricata TaxID=101098 RepID=UPI0022209838|nr:C2H2 type zinc-finger-domain-containing protein [Gamsiella multidivaricata]KAI7828221.1 C2H2 type zinc-finger-domain-containing protein [Gamsiella multidivaricata]